MAKYVTSFALLVWLTAGTVRADAFADCDSAYHYGANTARWFVSATFAKVGRGAISVERAHAALDNMLRVYGSRARTQDELAVCQLQGLWEGFVDQLAIEYTRLGSDELGCVDRLVLSARAHALLDGIAQSLDAAFFDELAAAQVFGGSRGTGTGVPWCEARPAEECAAALTPPQLDPDAGVETDALREMVADLLCTE